MPNSEKIITELNDFYRITVASKFRRRGAWLEILNGSHAESCVLISKRAGGLAAAALFLVPLDLWQCRDFTVITFHWCLVAIEDIFSLKSVFF